MKKELLFDMDGTITDLYGVEDWLPKLRSEDPSPYIEAKPIYDPFALNVLLDVLKKIGYKIVVVTWSSKDSTTSYSREVRKAKIEWLRKHNFPADEIHVIKYGTPKAYYMDNEADVSILLDDNEEVRNTFLKSKAKMKNENQKSKMKLIFDAKNENLLSYLVGLIEKEIVSC